MLHYYKFSNEVPDPVPAREVYVKRGPGKGWPEECPPLRAANAFGWDVLSATELIFRRKGQGWTLETEQELESDWLFDSQREEETEDERTEDEREPARGVPIRQQNAWFWDKGQTLPHVITPEVYTSLRNQVKVSTYLYMKTDPNELLSIGEIPNLDRPFRAFTAIVDTDWYPASYPWHCVIELDPSQERIVIEKGAPLCRLMVLRREAYFAREMSLREFEELFQRGQEWLARNGRGPPGESMDITRRYSKQQSKSSFHVIF